MDDRLLVRSREAVGDLDRVVDHFTNGHRRRACGQLLPKRLAFEQFFDDERGLPFAADVVDRQNVRVIERGGRERFLFEAAQAIGVSRDRGRQHFDGDVAAQPRVVGAVHLAHTARTDGADDLVRPETGAGLHCHAGAGLL